jgi:hypothetical protein
MCLSTSSCHWRDKLLGGKTEQIKTQNSLRIYLSSAQELSSECDLLFKGTEGQCEEKHYEVHEREFQDTINRLLTVQAWLRGRLKEELTSKI